MYFARCQATTSPALWVKYGNPTLKSLYMGPSHACIDQRRDYQWCCMACGKLNDSASNQHDLKSVSMLSQLCQSLLKLGKKIGGLHDRVKNSSSVLCAHVKLYVCMWRLQKAFTTKRIGWVQPLECTVTSLQLCITQTTQGNDLETWTTVVMFPSHVIPASLQCQAKGSQAGYIENRWYSDLLPQEMWQLSQSSWESKLLKSVQAKNSTWVHYTLEFKRIQGIVNLRAQRTLYTVCMGDKSLIKKTCRLSKPHSCAKSD